MQTTFPRDEWGVAQPQGKPAATAGWAPTAQGRVAPTHPSAAGAMSDLQSPNSHFLHRIHSYLCFSGPGAQGHSDFTPSFKQKSLSSQSKGNCQLHIQSQAFQLRLNRHWFLKIKTTSKILVTIIGYSNSAVQSLDTSKLIYY